MVATTIAAPIEQQVNGVEDMLYMSSQSTNDGQYNLTVTFKNGVDLDMAQVMVQNRVNLAVPQLPEVIRKTGVFTKKKSPDILLAISLVSPDGRFDQLYLSNYALMQIRDELSRLQGVSDVFLFGQRDYSMRVWVDQEKLAARSLTASDVVAALRVQNAAVALGQIGQPPMRDKRTESQAFQIPLATLGRLVEPEQFEAVILKTAAGRPADPAQGRGPRRNGGQEHRCQHTRQLACHRWGWAFSSCRTLSLSTRPTASRRKWKN